MTIIRHLAGGRSHSIKTPMQNTFRKMLTLRISFVPWNLRHRLFGSLLVVVSPYLFGHWFPPSRLCHEKTSQNLNLDDCSFQFYFHFFFPSKRLGTVASNRHRQAILKNNSCNSGCGWKDWASDVLLEIWCILIVLVVDVGDNSPGKLTWRIGKSIFIDLQKVVFFPWSC